MQAQGWYVDPYGAHEQRWFSGGAPTSLVLDGAVTSRDAPPDAPPPLPLVTVEPVDSGGDDLIRADEVQQVDQWGPRGPRGRGNGALAAVFAAERARERHFRRR